MNSAQTRAAIKRASQQARNAMQVLDGETVDALVAMYEDAAAQVKAAIRGAVDGSDAVPVSHLRDLLRQIEDVITRLGESRDALLMERLQTAAELGVRPYTLPGVAATGIAGQAVLESAAAMKVSADAVSFVQAFTAVDGLTLSDRVWRLNLGAKEVLTRAISQAVVSGWDAQRAAAAFMYNGDTVPADVSARLAGSKADALMRSADLLTGDNGEVWKADRVFRTEINRAHGTAYMAGAAKTPGFAGFRFLLSNRHPKPDICLRAGTRVTTKRGLVPIEAVKLGDYALTHLGRWRPVVKLYQSASGQSGLVRLRCQGENSRNQEVVMTPNHPVLTPSGWIPAGDLKTGSRVVCLASAEALPPQPCGVGANGTASPDFGETASTSGARKGDREECGAHALPQPHTVRTFWAGLQPPNGLPMLGVAKRLLSCCHQSMRGFLAGCALLRVLNAPLPCAGTYWGDAYQSLGYQHPALACTPYSNISEPCCRPQTAVDTSGKLWVWLHGLWRSRLVSKTPALALAACSVTQEKASHTVGSSLAHRLISPARRTSGRKSAWSQFASPVPIGLAWVQGVWRSVRSALGLSSVHHIAFTTRHAIVDMLPATGEDVFNIEVADDHSYIAAGVVVHNCDLLAAQNLYGLGEGVYPTADECPWPAHPNTLSFVVMVFEDEVSALDKAGKETVTDAMGRMSPEVRTGILGVQKAELYDAGKIKTWMIRSPLYAVKARMAGTARV